jgi:hypothetical protein
VNFCSRVSLASREAFAGTGVRGQAYVFLPVPKRYWHDREMNRQWASPDELEAIRAARSGGVVTRLYAPAAENGDEQPAPVLAYTAESATGAAFDQLLAVAARRWPIDTTGRPRLAICTHGTRDRCCAKFGFAAYQKAQEMFEAGTSAYAPIQCSHLGGDRFAATGIFLPTGSMYAHLDEIDLTAVCAAEAAGRIESAAYRGRVYDPPLAQLARAALARAGLVNDASAPIAVDGHGPGDVEVRLCGRRYRIRLHAAEIEFFGSCHAMASAKLSRGRRLVVESVERMEEPAAP